MVDLPLVHKAILSAGAIALTFALFVPYIRAIRKDELKPHVFSWVILGLSTFIVFLAQIAGEGGVGAWPIGLSGLITVYIALLSYRHRGDTQITRTDWLLLVGFGPTVRRAYHRPHEESAFYFGMAGVRNGLVILALEHYSATTVLFPAAVGAGCLLLSLLLVWRRRIEPAASSL